MKSQVAENKAKKVVAIGNRMGVQNNPMTHKVQIPEKIMFRPTEDDFSVITRLKKKLGLGHSQIIRLALRRLSEAEGTAAKAS